MIPAWSTHNYATEGGRKVHILPAYDEPSLCGIPEARGHMLDAGNDEPDIRAWLALDASDNVCGICKRRALALTPASMENA